MNSTTPDLGKPQLASHSWLEPIVVAGIMVGSLIINRRKNYSIFSKYPVPSLLPSSTRYTILGEEGPYKNDALYRSQTVCGITIEERDTSRWAQHLHSRMLQKFPFLVEMFYWALNYLFYSVTKTVSQKLSPAQIGVVQVAQDHATDILSFEHDTIASWIFPIKEVDFQQFFIQNYPSILTIFNRLYSLVHIPGTVLFLSWYYYVAENHASFAVARRTMTLGNLAAFLIFCVYPCMPPRLLPKSYGFYDTVRQEHAESIWVGGESVNQFAAMPSLHFTYAFVIGCTFIYHSGILARLAGKPSKSNRVQFGFLALAVVYPSLVLSVIIATANHYWLDAAVAVVTVTCCFRFNRLLCLLLPLEYAFCWVFKLAKPVPTTGDRVAHAN